ASFLFRKSGSFPNISCVKSQTCLFDQPLALAKEKIADSCFAVRRPSSEPFGGELFPLVSPLPAAGASKYRCSPTPNSVAHFFRQSVAAAFTSSPKEMIALSFLDRVIRDFPN